MPRVGEDLLCRPDLHDPAEVHDRDPVAEILGAGQVVGDVDVAEVELVLEVEHQLQDLGPHRHVEHGDRLVGHQHVGIHDDRPRQHDPLLLPPRQVAWVLRQEQLDRRETNSLQRLDDLDPALRRRLHAVHPEGVADPLLHGHGRVQRGVGVLEHHLDVAADLAQPATAHLGDVIPLEEDRTVDRGSEPEQRPSQRRLAAAALTDQPHDLASVSWRVTPSTALTVPESPAEQPCHRSAAQAEVHRQVLMSSTVGPRVCAQASSATVSPSSSGAGPAWRDLFLGPASQHSTRPPPSRSMSTGFLTGTRSWRWDNGGGSDSHRVGRPDPAARQG